MYDFKYMYMLWVSAVSLRMLRELLKTEQSWLHFFVVDTGPKLKLKLL
jgi:hypothetical protein